MLLRQPRKSLGHGVQYLSAYIILRRLSHVFASLVFLTSFLSGSMPRIDSSWRTSGALSALTDAQNALGRLAPVFEAQTMDYQDNINLRLPVAVKVENATFEWVVGAQAVSINKNRKETAETTGEKVANIDSVEEFKIINLNMTIPRGKLIAIVGPVGSGKSSLLQGVSTCSGFQSRFDD